MHGQLSWVTCHVSLLFACGPSLGGDGSADGGADGTGGTIDTTSLGMSGDTIATAASADSTGDICVEYTPQGAGTEVFLRMLHQGSAPVYFIPHGCASVPTFEVTNGAGELVPYLLDDACTPNTCAGFFEASSCDVGCDDCAGAQGARMGPGSVGAGAWPGLQLTELDLSPMCVGAANCPATCVRPDGAPPGTYSIGFTVYRACLGECECDDPAPEPCALWGAFQLADPVTFVATVDYPSVITTDIVITD